MNTLTWNGGSSARPTVNDHPEPGGSTTPRFVRPTTRNRRQDLAEITSPDYPGERLVACKNPLLEAERARKRETLLAATEADLEKINAATQRARSPGSPVAG